MPELSIGAIVLFLALCLGVLTAAAYGRRRGFLRSRISKIALVVAAGLLAALAMFGPSLSLLLSD